jgi:hypothetical protein
VLPRNQKVLRGARAAGGAPVLLCLKKPFLAFVGENRGGFPQKGCSGVRVQLRGSSFFLPKPDFFGSFGSRNRRCSWPKGVLGGARAFLVSAFFITFFGSTFQNFRFFGSKFWTPKVQMPPLKPPKSTTLKGSKNNNFFDYIKTYIFLVEFFFLFWLKILGAARPKSALWDPKKSENLKSAPKKSDEKC